MSARSSLSRWRCLFAEVDAKPGVFVLAAGLSFLGAMFEGASAGLLIPTLEGALRRDFGFLSELPGFRQALGVLPFETANDDAFLFGVLVGAIFVAVLLRLGAQYLGSIIAASALWKLVRRLQVRCLERYMSFGKAYFDAHNAGQLKSVLLGHPIRLISAIQTAQSALYWIGALCVYVALMFWISVKLSLVVIALFPLLYASVTGIVKRIKAASVDHADTYRGLHEHAFNLLTSMPLVQAANRQQAEVHVLDASSEALSRLEIGQARKTLLLYPIQELILLSAILTLVVVVANMLGGEPAKSLSGFLVFFYLLRRSATTFNDLNRVRGILGQLSGALDEMLDVFDDAGKPFVLDGAQPFRGLERGIELRSLCFAYEEGAEVLSDVTCAFEKGKTTAIVGKTGSGKTTLVSLLMRFYEVPAGMISVDDTDIRELNIASLRERVAYVSQESILVNDTIRANVCYGIARQVSDEELRAVITKARLDDLIARHPDGLEAVVGDRGVKVSGGERQRLALARALLRSAEILILDEATSSLDTRTERLVQEAIDEGLRGRTAIVIAHRLSTIENADWIILLEDGRLIEEGTLASLLERDGAFSAYWKAQHFDRATSDPL